MSDQEKTGCLGYLFLGVLFVLFVLGSSTLIKGGFPPLLALILVFSLLYGGMKLLVFIEDNWRSIFRRFKWLFIFALKAGVVLLASAFIFDVFYGKVFELRELNEMQKLVVFGVRTVTLGLICFLAVIIYKSSVIALDIFLGRKEGDLPDTRRLALYLFCIIFSVALLMGARTFDFTQMQEGNVLNCIGLCLVEGFRNIHSYLDKWYIIGLFWLCLASIVFYIARNVVVWSLGLKK